MPEVDDNGLLNFTVRKESVASNPASARWPIIRACALTNARWDDAGDSAGHLSSASSSGNQDGYIVRSVNSRPLRIPNRVGKMLGEASTGVNNPPHESRDGAWRGKYIKLDANGGGIAEWIKVCLIGDKLAQTEDGPAWEMVDDHPYKRPGSTRFRVRASFFGDCPTDRAIEPQKLRRTVRAIEDNMLMTVNQRVCVNTSAMVRD